MRYELKKNAIYDNVNGKPSFIYVDGDGSCLIRLDVEPIDISGNVGWECFEIRIKAKPIKAEIKQVIIRSIISECEEFALLNDYNKYLLGIESNEDAKNKYVEYLVFLEHIDALIKAEMEVQDEDC